MSKLSGEERGALLRIVLAAAGLIAVKLLSSFCTAALPWWLFYLVPYGIVGWEVLAKAGRNIARGEIFDENFLMALATLAALSLKDYKEAVSVMLE